MGYRKERIKEKRKSSVIMTVQELIEALNKVEDKSKDVVHYDDLMVEEIDEREYDIILY